jgi:hypothetical protein
MTMPQNVILRPLRREQSLLGDVDSYSRLMAGTNEMTVYYL